MAIFPINAIIKVFPVCLSGQLAHYLILFFPLATYLSVYVAFFSSFFSLDQLHLLFLYCLFVHPSDVPSSYIYLTSYLYLIFCL